MISKIKISIYILLVLVVFQSCSFNDDTIKYEEQLVVFASINAGFPVFDTVFVSRTAGVDEIVDAADLYIEDADVKLIICQTAQNYIFIQLVTVGITQLT